MELPTDFLIDSKRRVVESEEPNKSLTPREDDTSESEMSGLMEVEETPKPKKVLHNALRCTG